MKQAIECILKGETINKVSAITGLPNNTISRYFAMYQEDNEIFKREQDKSDTAKRKVAEVFTPFEENKLKEYLIEFEYLFYGLSEKECRILSYQMAVRNALKLPHDWKHNMASVEWLQCFKIRHPDMNIEKPDRCSSRTMRSIVWEKKNVTSFYDHLEKLVHSNLAFKSSDRIYNLDETYTSKDPQKTKMFKESKGEMITTCCIISASGTCLPPVKIIPPNTFVKPNPEAPEAMSITAPGGRMNVHLFAAVMQHFVNFSNSSLENPSILIMDIDLDHLSIPALNLAKASGIHIITLHPHIARRLQPLEVGLFDIFHSYYQEAFRNTISSSDDETRKIFDHCKVVDEAYLKAMTPENIKNAFKKCGIVPFDRDLFTDDDYRACLVTDQPCADCRARDDRSKKPIIEGSVDATDENASGASNDPQGEVADSSTASIDREDRTPKTKHAVQSQGSKMTPREKSAELDKLKRRMIRTVARLLKEKKTEDDVWEELQKESGSNCKNLWERMRSLTMKKLKRLLDADDRVELVPAVARMTLTDWLLYDLVIVHEKIDVIDRHDTTSSKVLNNLFSLVQLFAIEGRSGDDLAEAWTAATVYYNSKGHQCSPMLMQRRWYQIKELTRHKLYKFWFNYRGNQRLLDNAKQDPPSDLHKAIALKYPEIITKHFPEWEERIEQKLVIMPEEFEVKMRKKTLMKPSDENAPDVVIVEQKIDTISLDGDSDSEYSDEENSKDSYKTTENTVSNLDTDETSQTPVIVQVKTEPQEDDNIDTIEHSPYLTQTEESTDRFQDEIERLQMEEDNILSDEDETTEVGTLEVQSEILDVMMPLITNVQGGVEPKKEDITPDDASMVDTELETDENNVYVPSITIDDDDEIIPLKYVAEAQVTNQNESEVIEITSPDINRTTEVHIVEPDVPGEINPMITTVMSDFQAETKMEVDTEMPFEDEEEDVEDINMSNVCQDLKMEDSPAENTTYDTEPVNQIQTSHDEDFADGIISDINFADDGIEFADDGIEYVEDDEDQDELSESPKGQHKEVGNESSPKFDLKLLMSPVVYTTKLDEMAAYKDRPLFDTIDGKGLVDKIILESKPISAKSINIEPDKVENLPIKVENHDTHEVDDDLFQNDSLDDDDLEFDVIDEDKKVKLSSNLLQKPRSRSYNPIQLCKNPDFNTRLKWLTVGFFSSTRNRVLLKACKPMTIDLSKTFESKLIDGTMYLKPSDEVVKIENEKVNESTVSFLPSAVPVQSLMDTTDVDRILQEELKKRMLERSKTINLPNISVVRQINQQLLMAEVAPIMAQVDKTALNDNAKYIQQNITTEKHENEISLNIGAKRLKLDPAAEMNERSNHSQPDDSLLIARDNLPSNVVASYTNFNEAKNYTCGRPKIIPPVAVDESAKSKNFRVLEIQKKIKERQRKNIPTWLTKSNPIHNDTMNNSLLTIDTLYKMLNALDPCQEFASKINKPKKRVAGKPGDQTADKSAVEKPKIINENTLSNTTSIAKSRRLKKCCWAKSKIEKNTLYPQLRLTKHRCLPELCKCCCKEELRQVEIDKEIKLLKCTEKYDNISESIENVVQQSRDVTNLVQQPAVHIVNVDPNAANTQPLPPVRISIDVASQINMDECETVHIVNNAPEPPSTEEQKEDEVVTIDLVDDDVNTSPLSETKSSPTPLIRVYSASSKQIREVTSTDPRATVQVSSKQIKEVLTKDLKLQKQPTITPIRPRAPLTKDFKLQTQRTITPIRPRAPLNPRVPSHSPTQIATIPSKYKLFSQDPEGDFEPCSCRPNVVVDQTSATLLVDGTNDCPRHTKSRVSKETRIYLNRRHMSLTERPFFIAKNKILLSNVKPPRPESPPPPPPPDPVEITLPEGVQVVLLPGGTITYLVEPNFELTPEQIASMPLILSAIMQQIKASGITLPVQQSEVVPKPIDDVQNLDNSNVDGKQNQDNDGISETRTTPSNSKQKGEPDLQHEVRSELENNSANNEKPFTAHNDLKQIDESDLQNKVNLESENNSGNDEEPSDSLQNNESNSQNEVNPKSEKNSSTEEVPITAPSDSIQQLKNDSITTSGVVGQSHLQTEIIKEFSSNVPAESEVIKNTTDEEEHLITTDEVPANKEILHMDTLAIESPEEPAKNVGTDAKNEHNYASPEKNEAIPKTGNVESDNAAASTSRNLLSDLMEMSGIVEEDIVPVAQEPLQETAAAASLISQESTVQPVELSIIPEVSLTRPGLIPVPPLSPFNKKKLTISAQIDEAVHELNPITSFADLKYACDHNGLFFKLDLSTGVIVPINVCIQKNPVESGNRFTVGTTSTDVIDLTEEQTKPQTTQEQTITTTSTITVSSSLPPNKTTKGRRLSNIMPRKLSTMMPEKAPKPDRSVLIPVNLKRSVSRKTEAPSALAIIEKKKQDLLNKLSNNLKPLQMLQNVRQKNINILRKNMPTGPKAPIGKRIMNMNKIEAKIDLVDSDEPMEEEYLVENSSDDSDDEPLANLIIRNKAKSVGPFGDVRSSHELEQTPQNAQVPQDGSISQDESVTQDESVSQDKSLIEDDENIDFEEAIDAIEDQEPLHTSVNDMAEPVPTQLMLSGGSLNQPILLNEAFLPSNEADDEDSQDDCILGV